MSLTLTVLSANWMCWMFLSVSVPSDEPDRWAPLGPRVAVVRATYPCPPGHRKETCPDFACVRELDPTRVLTALDGLLVPTKP